MSKPKQVREKIIRVTPIYKKYVLNNSYDVVVQVGGRFSGKSHNEQIRLVANLGSKKDYKLLVIEDLETGMSEGFHAGLYERIRDFEHDPAYTPETKVAHIRNRINNNTAIFRGFSSDQQKLNVKKLASVTEIIVEEGEWMVYDDLMSLYQQLRGGEEKDRKLTILMNPVNPDCFVNQHLIESEPDKVFEYFPNSKRPKVFEKNIVAEFELDGKQIKKTIRILVVITTHFDNNYLTLEQRASIEQYRKTDPEKYLQLGEAKFIRPSGTYFKEFDKDIHVIEPFEIPKHWNRFFVLDYGLDMLAGYWIAVDFKGFAYAYKEVYQSDLIVSDAAKLIKEYEGNDTPKLRYAPPDLYNRNRDTGKSTIELMNEVGLHFVKAENARIPGWYNMKEWLKPVEVKCEQTGNITKTARLVFFKTCKNAIRTIPQLQRDEKNPNDVDSKTNHELTHSGDAVRYWCSDRQPVPVRSIEPYWEEDDDENEYLGGSFFE